MCVGGGGCHLMINEYSFKSEILHNNAFFHAFSSHTDPCVIQVLLFLITLPFYTMTRTPNKTNRLT